MYFKSTDAITQYLDELGQRLRGCGATNAADDLHNLVHASAWTTSSEWLGEIKLLLVKVARTERKSVSSDISKDIDAFIVFVDQAWKNANR